MIHLILLLGMMQSNTTLAPKLNQVLICAATDPRPGCSFFISGADGGMQLPFAVIPAAPTSDPIDVPAIEEPEVDLPLSDSACPPNSVVGLKMDAKDQSDVYRCHRDGYHTCADKSRILLHSEDGKYYCHKPQTE